MIHEELKALGYTPAWISHGFISAANLAEDYTQFTALNGDKSSEHYRYKRIKQWLKAQPSINRSLAATVVDVLLADPDPLMAHAAIVDVIQAASLNDEAFNYVATNNRVAKVLRSKILKRQTMLRKLRRNANPSQELIDEIVTSADSVTQLELLRTHNLTLCDYQSLGELGANKQVRHLARTQHQRLIKQGPGSR